MNELDLSNPHPEYAYRLDVCPNCGSVDIHSTYDESDDNWVRHVCSCYACDAEWTEIYVLKFRQDTRGNEVEL